MKITLDEVKRIAHLAHLRFGEEELEKLRGQLDQILGYIDKLDELSTEGVEPASGGTTGSSPDTGMMRDDLPLTTLSSEEALGNAPESGRGHFKVPKVIP